MAFDFTDFYISYPGHPRYQSTELIEDEVIRVIIQKWEMIIFTNKGELLFEPNFGANLVELLHETRLSADTIKNDLLGQVNTYISEIANIPFDLTVSIYEDPERFQEYMEIQFTIAEYDVVAVIT
jgi:hypothetical protein